MRPRIQLILPIVLLLASPLLWAQQAGDPAPMPQTLEQAEAQRQQAEAMRKDAERRYAAEEAACYKKVLVNPCIDAAKERHTKTIVEARRLEAPARNSSGNPGAATSRRKRIGARPKSPPAKPSGRNAPNATGPGKPPRRPTAKRSGWTRNARRRKTVKNWPKNRPNAR